VTAPYYSDDSVTLYLGDCLDVDRVAGRRPGVYVTLRLDDDYARIGFGPATVTFHKREADHHPKMHSAPNPDLPRLYYVDPKETDHAE